MISRRHFPDTFSAMQCYAERRAARHRWAWRYPRKRVRPRPRDNRTENGTYRLTMATVSRDIQRVRFGAWVRRALQAARRQGLTDDEIARRTGVGDSTFHRWAKGDWVRSPSIAKVLDFCAGLGLPPDEALTALGAHRPAATEPTADPDLDRIGRILNDPNTPKAEAAAIRRMLRALAGEHGQA